MSPCRSTKRCATFGNSRRLARSRSADQSSRSGDCWSDSEPVQLVVVLLGRQRCGGTAPRDHRAHRVAPCADPQAKPPRQTGEPVAQLCCAARGAASAACRGASGAGSRHVGADPHNGVRLPGAVLLVSGLNATVIQNAPEESWRKLLPVIFLDVARFALIGVGLAVILSYIWGVRIGGLFTALGVSSVVIGLMLQNSVGQVVSGLFMLFEQPFRIGDWLDTATEQGRIVEVNWRAVHIETDTGLRITPNSVLATTSFTNLSRPPGAHKLAITTTFSTADPPDKVCALLSRLASALPQLKTGVTPTSMSLGGGQYCTTIGMKSAADDSAAQATFLRWLWYAARRESLHLDGDEDKFST